ncbi:hypothetical protein FIM04_01645 [SAR202 cluster bacterium AC-409-J13_OGT_754m]|nr:hypothetical protein [SAR202 cluster bacterium AC-409-J13_OGT_754m]
MIIKSKHSLSLKHTVLSHGWFQLAPWTWDSNSGVLSRLELFQDGYLSLISCSQINSKSIFVQVPKSDSNFVDENSIKTKVKRWLSLDWNPRPAIQLSNTIDPDISDFIQAGGGRFLRGSSFYEDCIKTILTINANWQFTVRMAKDLSEKLGQGSFPTPSIIKQTGPTVLRNDLRLGFRAEVIFGLTQQLLDRGIITESGILKKVDLGFQDMIRFHGLGPYSVHHILMLIHDYEMIPVDSEVASYCKNTLNIDSMNIQEHFAKWDKYRFLGYKLRRIIDSIQTA